MKFDFKKYTVDIIGIVVFALMSLSYCYPQFQGKKLMQHDNVSWQGMAHEAMEYHEKTGKDVLWSNSMFGGMPTYTTYVGAANTNYPGFVQTVLQGIGKPAYFFFIAMLCFYILMQVLGVNKWLSMVGALAYAFASYNAIIIGVGHDTKMLTIGYIPAALAGLLLIYREKWLTGAALYGIVVSLIFTNNHFQVIYYALIMFACFGVVMLVMAVQQSKLKQFIIATAIAGVTTVVGAGPAMTSVFTTMEYTKETMRGGASELSGHDKKTSGGLDKDYAFRWSNGIGETFCIMVPYLYGGSSGESAEKAPKTSELVGGNAEQLPLYWGPQPFLGGPIYFGAIVCFLFVLGLLVVRSPHKWWIVAASAICIIMSWGKNFESINYFLFDHLPMLNKFRTPSMSLVIPQFLFPLLGFWAVNDILTAPQKEIAGLVNKVKLAALITAGICVVVGAGGTMFFSFTGADDGRYQPELAKALKEDRIALAVSSGVKSAIYIMLAAGALWLYLSKKIKAEIMIAGLGLLVLIDLLPVAHDYLNEKNYVEASEYDNEFQPREVDKLILRDPDPYYRVLDLSRDTYNDAVQAYFHKCIGGYHPAKMEIYQDLIDRQLGGHGFNREVLNMLNTKYVIVGGRQQGAPHVIPNPMACGNAWFVDELKWAATADEEMNALNAPSLGDTATVAGAFDARKTAVMRSTFQNGFDNYKFGKDSASFVKLAQYGLDEISFTSNNSRDGLAVFSDIYYDKGWKAYIDGKETKIMKANYVLRALKIPAGAHSIKFEFKPDSFYKGKNIALVSSIVLVLLVLAAVYTGLQPAKTTAE
jgi:Bacterial membrane protein YfhO